MSLVKSIFKTLWFQNKNKTEMRTLNMTTMGICLLYDKECLSGLNYEAQQHLTIDIINMTTESLTILLIKFVEPLCKDNGERYPSRRSLYIIVWETTLGFASASEFSDDVLSNTPLPDYYTIGKRSSFNSCTDNFVQNLVYCECAIS